MESWRGIHGYFFCEIFVYEIFVYEIFVYDYLCNILMKPLNMKPSKTKPPHTPNNQSDVCALAIISSIRISSSVRVS